MRSGPPSDSLRSRLVEAGARRLHPVAWQKSHNLREAEATLDAFLDCLTENLDETVHVRHDETVDRTEPWRLGDAYVDDLLAVLRNPNDE